MILGREVLTEIQHGRIDLVFRRWKRPSVRAGGTLMTSLGRLQIRSVDPIELDDIGSAEAQRAGYASRESLLSELERREGQVYRVELGALEPDPRIALRTTPATEEDLESIASRLARLDASSSAGPWTLPTLELIGAHPAVRAGDLAEMLGLERLRFKQNVRKLKSLGLTESLEIGYRLSPRGESVLRRLRAGRSPAGR